MKRLGRETIRLRVGMALQLLKPYQRRALGLPSAGVVESVVVDDIVNRIMGRPESEAVVLIPDLAGPVLSPRRGQWDVDEPHPHPDLPFAEH